MQLWHVEVRAKDPVDDPSAHSVSAELNWLGMQKLAPVSTARLALFATDAAPDDVRRLAERLFVDPIIQTMRLERYEDSPRLEASAVTVSRKPGVMDPTVESIRRGAARLGVELGEVRSGTCYRFAAGAAAEDLRKVGERALANSVIEEIQIGRSGLLHHSEPHAYRFKLVEIPLPSSDGLEKLSRDLGLALNRKEMDAVAAHFARLGRNPTDIELETIAQTWSEHCKHKTFGAIVRYEGRVIDNLLKSTIFKATKDLAKDFCVSVFKDNAGIVRFDDKHNLCFKVETHNHPSAIEPYGGAGTGLGGVIRDILGTGLGAKPVANIDVFCLGLPNALPEDRPTGVIHPLRVLKGVVSGVRDYGNRMGIPTVAGGLFFDERYTGNPLVYCGTIGLIPRDRCEKTTRPGDAIVAVGGRTGRDGIHGATFSSMELHEDSETQDGGAVQIGNAITEKRMMDVILAARDRGLYRNITDCGAGGFSSAVGEMGAETGARVRLEKAPLKYPGLSYREIWISEAQERMVLAVPPESVSEFLALCASEDVEASVLGEFTDSGRLEVLYDGAVVADLDMHFLHDGVPRPELDAHWSPPAREGRAGFAPLAPGEALKKILASPNVASKEWVIRQYDHEVQGQSCVKSLVGARSEGPGDASVLAPVLDSDRGFAVACGMNPYYGDLDPYHMATAAIDEAMRNVVAVGADPDQTAILDNFSWGNCAKPDRLGALVRASEGCYDASMALRAPFISGKDSLNNEYATKNGTIVIPWSLLVSALAIVPDVERSVTMDLKRPGSALYLVGRTKDELGGSHYMLVHGRRGDDVPKLDRAEALPTMRAVHAAIRAGLVLACHDLAEGGLAAAAAEMAIAGEIGAEIEVGRIAADAAVDDPTRLFSESLTRFLIEVAPENAAAFEAALAGRTLARVGRTVAGTRLRFVGRQGEVLADESVADLRNAFRYGFEQHLEGARRA